jgi:hypothetical protein
VSTNVDSLIEEKKTTQRAPLERFLNYLRTKKIISHVHNAVVLDFGCGSTLRTLRSIGHLTKSRYGIDSYFKNDAPKRTPDGISVVGSFSHLNSMLKQNGEAIDVIISLACFEHMETSDFKNVLAELKNISRDGALIVGTVPRPPAKPVLEFLSYRLGLIDRSQIEDHKVYYDQKSLANALKGTGWELSYYTTFQFGMNSFFRMEKTKNL